MLGLVDLDLVLYEFCDEELADDRFGDLALNERRSLGGSVLKTSGRDSGSWLDFGVASVSTWLLTSWFSGVFARRGGIDDKGAFETLRGDFRRPLSPIDSGVFISSSSSLRRFLDVDMPGLN